MRIAANTPAGNFGREVVHELLQGKQDVVMVNRNPTKIADLVERGAQLIQGSIDSPSLLDLALENADAFFWLTPFAFDQPDYLHWARRTLRLQTFDVAEKAPLLPANRRYPLVLIFTRPC